MQCSYFDAGACRSCSFMGAPYPEQLEGKEGRCRDVLDAVAPGLRWLPSWSGPESRFRNKAKMVVTGTVANPQFGILDGGGTDLVGCGLYEPGITAAFPPLKEFVRAAALVPYDVEARRGELKYVLVTVSPAGRLMIRFVLRSSEPVGRIRKHLPLLLAAVPADVVSVNLLPQHRAVTEGDDEVVLTDADSIRMDVNDIGLRLRPRSFFQTNTAGAAALYRQASQWVGASESVWDLYCGVGGFALHCARMGTRVLGIETSGDAVEAARSTARDLGVDSVTFIAGDAAELVCARGDRPEVVIVNPPRRGIGAQLARWLENSGVRRLVYSSCNVESLARDLELMPSLRPQLARVFDLFPQTSHAEVALIAERI